MKHNLWKRILSLFLTLTMALGLFPVGVLAAGVPETLVTSLTELYSGDEERARADLEALYAAGLLDDDGRLVDLDIREDGGSVELSALVERITNGETVGALTVNGNAATPEQIVQISQVKAAIEVAQLLDEEIDVTNEHVENLENLLTGIQNGDVDLEGALKTGALSLKSTGNAPLLGETGDLSPTIQKSDLSADYQLPNTADDDLSLLTLSEDGNSYIGPYFDSTGFYANHQFEFKDQDLQYKQYYYIDSRFSGYYIPKSGAWNDLNGDEQGERSQNYPGKNKYVTGKGYEDIIDWDNVQWGVGKQNGQQMLVVVLPIYDTNEAQQAFANQITDELYDCMVNGEGVQLPLPAPYGNVTVTKYMPNMYFSFSHSAYGQNNVYGSWYNTARIRYPAYVIEKGGKVAGLAACMAVRPNVSTLVRRDRVNLYMDTEKNTFGGTTAIWNEHEYNKGAPYLPRWDVTSPVAAVGKDYQDHTYYMTSRKDALGYTYFYYYPAGRDDEYGTYDGFEHIVASCPRAPRVQDFDLEFYVAPDAVLNKTKFTERTAAYETAAGGFIKLTNPEKAAFPYLYPGDPEHPENQYDLELLATKDLYEVLTGGGVIYREKDLDLKFTWQFSDRENFVDKEVDFSSYAKNSFLKYELNDSGEVVLTPTSASETKCSIGAAATNGGVPYDVSFPTQVIARDGEEPYLMIPRSSQTRETLTDVSTNVFFTSNITQQNQDVTVFSAKLYKVGEDQIGKGIPEGAAPITVENWGEFPSAPSAPVTRIPVPGTALTEAGAYAVTISTECNDGTKTTPFSVTAYVKVKNAPAKISLDKLNSYSVVNGEIPDIKYTVDSKADNVQIKYTVQPAGEAVSVMKDASGGTIPFDPGEISGTKKAYTITVYARNTEADPWSTDSMLLTVYNDNPIKLVLKDVPFGEIGGRTGGVADNEPVTSATMDNSGRIEGLISKFKDEENDYSLDDLRTDVNLQKLISADYGSGTLGAISDRLQWSATKDGKASNNLTLNYNEKGSYADVRNYSYTYYIPSSDFLMVGTNDETVKVTATHALTGIETSVNVTVNTLKDKLYLFRFNPKTTVSLSYTDKKGGKKTATTNAQGELALYEPDGIASDVLAMGEVDEETYVGTILNSRLTSGEQDVLKLQVYPCNYLSLVPISSQTLTFLTPAGQPYNGTVILRGGVYANNQYCPNAGIRTAKGDNTQYLRESANVRVTNGKATVWFDPSQFTSLNNLRYVFEYRFANDYQPGYVIINPASKEPADSIVKLQAVSGGAEAPQIIRQDYQQYLDGTKPTSYKRNVIDSKENIGVSPNFPKAELYTVIALPGENVTEGEKINTANGYSNYENSNAIKFAYCLNDGKTKLTGQTDISSDSVTAAQITNLSQLNDKTTYFVFPFSSMPMVRSTYKMTDGNMATDGITDQGDNPTPTARIKAVFTRGDMTVRSMNMPFGVTNVSHQPDLNSNQGATAVGSEVRGNLKSNTDIGAIFRSINVNDMIRKGFVFLGSLAGAGGDNPINLMILPTQDPATFRIIAFVGANQRGGDDDGDGLSVNFNAQDLAEDMSKFKKEMEELNKKKDDEKDSGGEGSMEFNFYGTIILEARVGIADGKWNIAFRGGNVGTNVKGKYEWGQTFFCGPYPAFVSFEVGFHADLEVAFGNKSAVRAMLLDAALGVSVEAFAGLGFDLSIVALQLGIYGQIGADVNFLLLTPSKGSAKTGTKLTISGEIGLKLKVKLLFISYTSKFASTGFNWTKMWNDYDQIKQYWNNQGFGVINGITAAGRAYAMYLFADGSTIVEIEGRAELEDRDYLELAERAWTGGAASGRRLLRSAGPIANVQTNAYPYSHPAFTDDGELFLYVSDNDNADDVQSVVSYAVKSGTGYENKGRVDISVNNVLADLDVVASGTKDNAFAAWVKQVETPKRADKNAEVTNDELSMMFNATEIYAGSYKDSAWTTERLTDNSVADMSPTVASYDNHAIVAWRSMNASALVNPPDDGILINEDFEDGKSPSDWKTEGGYWSWQVDTLWRLGNLATPDNGAYVLFSNGKNMNVFLPTVDLRACSAPRLSFEFVTSNLTVQYSEDEGKTWTDLPGATAMTSETMKTVNVDLPKKKLQIRFSTQGSGNHYLDNIVVSANSNPVSVTDKQDEVMDITSMFDVENNINYRVYDGSKWETAQVAYNGNAGTVNAIDSAMLSDGTAILVYTVRTGDDVTTTETFYTVIDANGNTVTTGRLTNDSYTDTNAQVTAVNDKDGGYFVLGWYSEHDAGEGSTAEYEVDADGKPVYDASGEPVVKEKAVVAHDIRLARINANGSYDINFPESIGGTGEAGVSSDFHFSAPAGNTDLTNVSVVWSQKKDSDEAEDAGKYELNAVRFFQTEDVTGLTAPTDIAETSKNYTIDRFDTYTDREGAVHAIILGTDYSTIVGDSVYDTIDLTKVTTEVNENYNNPADPDNNTLTILDGEAISSLKLATGTFPETAADVTADINISEVIPGFTTPVQFTVTNTGTGKLETVTAQVGTQTAKDFTVNLLPNQSATLLMSYSVPESAVSDPAYTVTSSGTTLGSGTLTLNRPDVGISGINLLQEYDGKRDIQVMLSNDSEIPLAGSGKTVKLAFYKDPFHENVIKDSEVSIPTTAYADIDAGTYTTVQTLNVTDIAALVNGEIPEEGVTVYARAWVADTEEPNTYNNDNYISFTGLLARNNGEKLTMDTTLEVGVGSYTVYADVRNNSMQDNNVGTLVAAILDSNENVIAQKPFQNESLSLTKEQSRSLSVTFAADDLNGKTPAEATVGTVYTVTFALNGGASDPTINPVQTDLAGHITLPTTKPTPPTVEEGADPLFFAGWYTDATNGVQITESYTFTGDTTVYAHYVNHEHAFTYTKESEDSKTIIATCANTDQFCYLNECKATLTIAAPEGEIVYTGSEIPAVITDENAIQGSAKVLYATKGEGEIYGDPVETVPVNVGAYRASITLGTGDGAKTANVEYTIGNATLTNVSVSQDGTLTYTGEAQTPQVTTAATSVNSQTVTFTYSKTQDGTYGDMPSFTNVADAGTVYYKASAPNHEDETGSFTVTMNKATPSAPAAPTTENISASSVTLNAVDGCEYSMDGKTWQESTLFAGLTKETQYTFYQRLKATDNYNASSSSTESFTTTAHDHEWGSFSATGATITATCGNSDKAHVGETTATMVIKAPTLTTYGGEGSASATVTNGLGGISVPTIVYKQGDTVLEAAPTAAGDYTASITLTGVNTGANATGDVTASVNYTISKAPLTVTANNKTITYGDAPTNAGVTYSGFVNSETESVLGGTLDYDYSYAQYGNVAGDHTITPKGLTSSNYDISFVPGTLTVNQKEVGLSWTNTSFTYNGLPQKPTATATGLVNGDAVAVTVSGAQTNVGNSYTATASALTGDKAGNYKLPTATTQTFAISKVALTVTANDKTITYGDAPSNNGVTYTGFVNGETETSLGGTLTYNYSYSQYGNVGSAYTITPSGLTSGNYNITFHNGTLTVVQKEANLAWDHLRFDYDGKSHAPTAAVTNLVNNDTVNVTVTGAQVNTGNYTATASALTGSRASNYKLPAETDQNFSITEKDFAIAPVEIKGAHVKLAPFAYDGDAVSTAEFDNDGAVTGANGELVQGDDTKEVYYFYQSTAFLKSQTDAVYDYYTGRSQTLTLGNGATNALTPTTFEPGKHYVLAVIKGNNYSNTYITQSVFEVTQNLDKDRTAPTAPEVADGVVTVAEADRAKTLEYSLDGTIWLPVSLDKDGKFTAEWQTPVSEANLLLRETADAKYAKPSESATGKDSITTTTFTVVYDANGGVQAPDAVTVTSDRTITAARQGGMTRTGYTFTGWNTAADGTGTDYEAGSTLNNGVTLYAQWEANAYKVTFNANGGTGTMDEMDFTYGEAEKPLTKIAGHITRDDYTFLGWAKSAGGSAVYQDGQSVKNLTSEKNVTLYAVWAKDVYNITGKAKSENIGDIKLTLIKGENKFGESNVTYSAANEETGFSLNGVPAGMYNLIAEQNGVTMTVAVTITDKHVELGTITMPSGNTSSVMKVTGAETPAVVVKGLDTLAANEEVNERSVTITMTVEAKTEAQTEAAGEVIRKDANVRNLEFMDITVTKAIYNNSVKETTEQLTETSNVIELAIPFDFSGKAGIKLYRYHDNEAQTLKESSNSESAEDGTFRLDRQNGLIYVYTDKFSTYAIGYSNPSSGSGGSGGGAGAAQPTVNETANGTISIAPEKAKSGEKVTITAKPNEGYEVDAVTVTDANGKAVSVTRVNDTTYTFTQPNGNVKIDVTFKPDVDLSKFVDVDASAWYAEAIRWAVKNNVMNGVSPKYFNPNGDTTRAMVVTMLWRLEGSPAYVGASEFSDVDSEQWYGQAVRWANAEGIVMGDNGKFAPNDPVTREQLATILYRYAQYKKRDVSANANLNGFGDAMNVSEWALPAMEWACDDGVINGMDGNLVPKGKATRAQVATMLMRFIKNIVK